MKTALFKSVLDEALEKAGRIMRKNFGHVGIRYKGKANLVTKADIASQKAILDVISRRLPDHDYKAEESGVRETGADFVWVIDPLDGTTNYAHGYPACCVSIALLRKDKPVVAGVYDPFRDECFLAEAGQGARLNGKRMHVSRVPKVAESLLVTGFAYDRAERSHFYVEIYREFMVQCHDVRRLGSAALDLAWIAAGRSDGYWEFNLAPWDVAAGLLLVTEAGGRVTDFHGKLWTGRETFGRETLATNGRIHDEMLGVLKKHV